jgi:hypothetical protein
MKFTTFLFAVLAANLAWAPTASAQSSATIYVDGDQTSSWEGRLKLVPNLKKDGGVSVDAVNAFIRDRLSRRAVSSPLTTFVPICLMNFARPQDIVSSDRKTQVEIRANLQEYPRSFAETYEAETEKFLLRVGIFEDCKASEKKDDVPATFMALVITDQQGTIRDFDALDWNFIRLFKRNDGKVNVSGCFACGEVREVSYNPAAKEFYYKWIGH